MCESCHWHKFLLSFEFSRTLHFGQISECKKKKKWYVTVITRSLSNLFSDSMSLSRVTEWGKGIVFQMDEPLKKVSLSIWATITKYHRPGNLQTTKKSLRHNSRCWSPKLECQPDYVSALFQLTDFSLYPHRMEWTRAPGGFLLIRALIPFMRAPPLRPDHLLKVPSSIILGIRISTYGFWGHTNIQIIAERVLS